jgi:hypothetical protein
MIAVGYRRDKGFEKALTFDLSRPFVKPLVIDNSGDILKYS